MVALKLELLGRFRSFLGREPLESFRTNKVQALLIYLAIEADAHGREALTSLLWPGMPERSARANLRQIVYYLRKNIPELEAVEDRESRVQLMFVNRRSIQLNPAADVVVDARQFEDHLANSRSHDHTDLLSCQVCQEDLLAAAELYRGNFLENFYLDDSNNFEEWAQVKRDAYRRQILDALEILAAMYSRRKEYSIARTYADRQLGIDNLRESAYRQLMEIMALSGQRTEAMAVYENCRRLLAEELGMAPSKRTTELFDQILAGDLSLELKLGQGVRGYELKDEIGEGAFGSIHRAIQPSINREVAVKVIRRKYANDPEFIRRFEFEAQTIAHLEHPHIVPLYDYWRDPDGAYLVMRYLKGGSLLNALETGPWDPDATAEMLDQVAQALEAAHQQGVVHRDIKPANILLDDSGNAYLSDFGIAKDLMDEMQLTAEGAMVGTPDYISPEQILNDPVTAQTDIYSLGAVLYETLTGERPFADSSVVNLIYKHLNEPIALLADSRPDLHPGIDVVIQRATAKQPADRYANALEMAAAFRSALQGISGEAVAPAITPDVKELYNPYKGLRSFQEADADDFYGREGLVEQLISGVTGSRFLAVVGPSGSGKSSAVKAGLIPALRKGVIPSRDNQARSDKWFVAEMTPGTHPLDELELALWPIAVDPPPSLVEPMRRDTRGLSRTIRRILPDEEGAQLLLVIDQFEELFTLVKDDERREFFIDSLLTAIRDPRGPLRVVVTLRADFYDRPLQSQSLGVLLKENTEIVLPMSAEELTWAIREPAHRVGVRLEPGLAEAIVADVSDQPGGLPLLQFALTEMFEQRQDRQMTRQSYQKIGGVTGALGRRADEIYEELDGAGQAAARQLFLRLVTLGEGVEDTRRRVLRSEIEGIGEEQLILNSERLVVNDGRSAAIVAEVLDSFGAARLLTFDYHPATREPTVEVAHEALLREWRQLRSWLDESRNDVRTLRVLSLAAADWHGSEQDDSYLLRGSRLELFAGWAASDAIAMTESERQFLGSSIAWRAERQGEEEARRQEELKTAKKLAEMEGARAEEQEQAAGRLRRRAVFLSGALVVTAVLAIAAIFFANQSNQNAKSAAAEANHRATAESVAIEERQLADEQRAIAEEQSQLARSRELAAASINNLETDPELSILLALEGLSIKRSLETVSALHRAIVASPLRQVLRSEIGAWLTASLDGRMVYVSGPGGGAAWDMTTGELLYRNPVPEGDWINRADFSPDGSLLVLPGESYNDAEEGLPGEVTLADAQTGQELVKFVAHEAFMQGAKFSPDGSLFATVSGDLKARVWDVAATLAEGTGQLVAEFCCLDSRLNGLDFRPGSHQLAIAMGAGDLVVWDLATDERLFTLGPDINWSADYSPDGRYLVTAGKSGNIEVWDADTGEQHSRGVSHSSGALTFVKFSYDGSQIVSTGFDATITLWRFSPDGLEMIRELPPQSGFLAGAAFSPDGRFLYTGAGGVDTGGAVQIWDISPAGSSELAAVKIGEDAISDFHLLGDGSQLLTSGQDGMLRLWDTESWQEIRSLQAHEGGISESDVSPDGRMIATVSSADITPKVWDVDTWQLLFSLEGHQDIDDASFGPGVTHVQFSPDGRRLATGGNDNTARIWDAASGDLLLTLRTQRLRGGVGRFVRFNPNGRLLVTKSDQRITIWDPANGQLLQTIDVPEVYIYSLTFNPDGSLLAVGGQEKVYMWGIPVEPWSEEDGGAVELYQLQSDARVLGMIDFSPDGKRMAVVGNTGLAEIRDAATGELLLNLQHPAGIGSAELTPDGQRLMTGDIDGVFRIWSLDLEELIDLAHSRVTRELTEEECQQYLYVVACPVE